MASRSLHSELVDDLSVDDRLLQGLLRKTQVANRTVVLHHVDGSGKTALAQSKLNSKHTCKACDRHT